MEASKILVNHSVALQFLAERCFVFSLHKFKLSLITHSNLIDLVCSVYHHFQK